MTGILLTVPIRRAVTWLAAAFLAGYAAAVSHLPLNGWFPHWPT